MSYINEDLKQVSGEEPMGENTHRDFMQDLETVAHAFPFGSSSLTD